MEGNKKENGEERVKIYDKEMYISQEKLKTIAIIIIIFIIGFIAGYFSNNIISSSRDRKPRGKYIFARRDTSKKTKLN